MLVQPSIPVPHSTQPSRGLREPQLSHCGRDLGGQGRASLTSSQDGMFLMGCALKIAQFLALQPSWDTGLHTVNLCHKAAWP